MGGECSYGRLFHHEIDYKGKWIKDLIQRISQLHCMFGEITSNNANGIYIHNPADIFTLGQSLGEEIAKCMVSSYITKNVLKYGDTRDEYFTIKRTVNMVLFNVDREFVTLIDKKTIECIITILNHPHFTGCKTIDDIQNKIPSISNLNDRFKGVYESSDEEDEEDDHGTRYSCKGEAIPPKVPNIFLD